MLPAELRPSAGKETAVFLRGPARFVCRGEFFSELICRLVVDSPGENRSCIHVFCQSPTRQAARPSPWRYHRHRRARQQHQAGLIWTPAAKLCAARDTGRSTWIRFSIATCISPDRPNGAPANWKKCSCATMSAPSCARAVGYGANYLLKDLDLEKIKSNPKIFVGYSDITALLTYFATHAAWLPSTGRWPPKIGRTQMVSISRRGKLHCRCRRLGTWLSTPESAASADGEAEGDLIRRMSLDPGRVSRHALQDQDREVQSCFSKMSPPSLFRSTAC